MNIHRKYIVDENGVPKEVVLLLKDFKKIEELLGMDLSADDIEQLHKARQDRERGNKDAYLDLDSI
jgi:hypothetical protein